MPEFTQTTVDKAAELAPPEQVGSFAWHVLGSTGEIRYVQTDARITDDDAYMTFLSCSCPAGQNNKTRAVSCSHALKTLQALYLRAHIDEEDDDRDE